MLAVALEFGTQRLTCGELDRAANRMADRLRHLGVGRGAVVGPCLERFPSLVVGLLGVLKAGGAYLPLDPAYPPAVTGPDQPMSRLPPAPESVLRQFTERMRSAG